MRSLCAVESKGAYRADRLNWTYFVHFTKWTEVKLTELAIPSLCIVQSAQRNWTGIWAWFILLLSSHFRHNWTDRRFLFISVASCTRPDGAGSSFSITLYISSHCFLCVWHRISLHMYESVQLWRCGGRGAHPGQYFCLLGNFLRRNIFLPKMLGWKSPFGEI